MLALGCLLCTVSTHTLEMVFAHGFAGEARVAVDPLLREADIPEPTVCLVLQARRMASLQLNTAAITDAGNISLNSTGVFATDDV